MSLRPLWSREKHSFYRNLSADASADTPAIINIRKCCDHVTRYSLPPLGSPFPLISETWKKQSSRVHLQFIHHVFIWNSKKVYLDRSSIFHWPIIYSSFTVHLQFIYNSFTVYYLSLFLFFVCICPHHSAKEVIGNQCTKIYFSSRLHQMSSRLNHDSF